MIVKMRHLDLVCIAAEKDSTLSVLRSLGAVHLDLSAAQGAEVGAAKGEAEQAERAVRMVLKARKEIAGKRVGTIPRTVEEIFALADEFAKAEEDRARLQREIGIYEPYGDFDPELAKSLIERVDKLREVVKLPETLPRVRLSAMKEELSDAERRMSESSKALADSDEAEILKTYPELADRIAFEAAKEIMKSSGAIAVVSGWLPEPMEGDFRAAAKENGWGLLLREPLEGEIPPTLVEPPKAFAPMKLLFSGLGIAPAYTETDVSVPFMCYFSLFFAMLVGDGAYGAIFLMATLFGWGKYRKVRRSNDAKSIVMRSWLVLLTVFSTATIVWGVLSNTWFGAGLPFADDWPTVRWLADPSYHNMMLLCFTIGVSHLMLARIWSGICRINDTTCIAQFGWAGILLFMYFITNSIVGVFKGIPNCMFWVFGVSLVAVFGFTVKPSEIKTKGAELGMLPLNIMSALGDIISYVRLFAVGLASVKVAENFNSMATGLLAKADDWYLKALMALAMVAILLAGHLLNLAMAGLSVLVHAVRLNTLEFSNHMGVSWSGYQFRPFRKG